MQLNVAGAKALVAKVQSSHPWRAWQWNLERRGSVMAGGIAFAGLFSVFGALLAGFSLLGLALGNDGDLYDSVVGTVDQALPGLLDVPAGDGVVDPADVVQSDLVTWTGGIAFATALFAGLGWLDALRMAIRVMFDLPWLQKNVVVKKLGDAVVLATVGLSLVASALVSLLIGSAASWLLRLVGVEDGPVATLVLRLAALGVVVALDVVILVVILRLLAGVRLPWARLRGGVLIGALAMAALTQGAGLLAGSAASRNPLLATGAALVGLLLILNLVSRVMLYACAWIAVDVVPDPVHERVDLRKAVRSGRPAAQSPAHRSEPTSSQRATDRTTLAAGVVLGAVGLATARVLGRGLRSVVSLVRGAGG